MGISKAFLEKYYKDKDNFAFSTMVKGENSGTFYIQFKPLKDHTDEEIYDLKRRYNNINIFQYDDSSVAYREIIEDQIILRRNKKLNKIKERWKMNLL